MSHFLIRLTSVILMLVALPTLASTEDPNEVRAQHLDNEIRCVVCQSEAIADSQADMARDLRQLVHDKIESGATDDEILDYLKSRYGDFILLKPPLQRNTYVLWIFPAVALLSALGISAAFYRRRRQKTLSKMDFVNR